MVLSDKKGFGWKVILTGWAFIECLLFGGIHYGWGSLNFILKSEGIYAELCPQDSPPVNVTANEIRGENNENIKECKAQDSRMVLCFTITATLFTVGCVVLGHVNYKCGTRVTRIIACLIFTTGSLLMAFTSIDHPWLMFPGLSCLAIGGIPLVVTNIQLSYLFEKGSSTVVGLLNAGYDASASVMLLVKIAFENGYSRQHIFFFITGIHTMVLVNTFFFLPKHFIKKQKTAPKVTTVEVIELERPQDNGDADKLENDLPPLMKCVRNPIFLTHTVWLCLLQLRYYYFIGTLNPYLRRLLDGDEDKVSYFTNVCYYTMAGGLITTIISGFIYDCQKKRLKDGKSERFRKVAPAAVPQGIASLLSVAMTVLVLIPQANLLYIIFILLTIKRSFLHNLAVAFIGENFPEEYFGILYGIVIVSAGVFGLFQYALFIWAESYDAGLTHVDIFLLLLVCVSFLHPAYLWISSLKEERKSKNTWSEVRFSLFGKI